MLFVNTTNSSLLKTPLSQLNVTHKVAELVTLETEEHYPPIRDSELFSARQEVLANTLNDGAIGKNPVAHGLCLKFSEWYSGGELVSGSEREGTFKRNLHMKDLGLST